MKVTGPAHFAAYQRQADPPMALALGIFDGVHRGHQLVFDHACRQARKLGGLAGVLTFANHPCEILAPKQCPPPIISFPMRCQAMAHYGIETVFAPEFSAELAQLDANAFVFQLLLEKLAAAALVVGENFHFGAGARGNAELLQSICAGVDIPVTVVPALQDSAGNVISSTRVRQALAMGDVILARQLLGRPPVLSGRVAHGRHLGRKLGFPTANLETDVRPLVPLGVYWAVVTGSGLTAPGMVSYSNRPTVADSGDSSPILEVHLPDRELDLYDQELCIHLLMRHRGIIKFSSPQALITQLEQDRVSFERFLHDTQLPDEYIGCKEG